MKDTRTTEYLEKLGKVTLSSDTKLRMRDELSAFADFHAVRVVTGERSIGEVRRHSVFALFTNSPTRIMKATLLLALMVGVGGTSFAAQGAVPGDLLYPVKVHVNEGVRSGFAFGADAKAQFEADLLAIRLQEAEDLASEGKLEGDLAIDVRSNIQAQFDRSLAASAEASAGVAADVRTRLASSLTTFQRTMENTIQGEGDTSVEAEYASDASVHLLALEPNANQGDVSMMMSTKLAAEIDVAVIVEHARARLDALKKTIADASSEMSTEVAADLKVQLDTAEKHMIEAEGYLETNAKDLANVTTDKANEILGTIESELSLMGTVTIEQSTGYIIDITLGEVGAIIEGDASFESGLMDIDSEIDASLDAASGLSR